MNFISKQPKENKGLFEQYLKVSLGKSFCRQIIQNGLCQNNAFRQKNVNRKNPVTPPPPNQAAGSTEHLSAPLCVPVSSNSKKMKKGTILLFYAMLPDLRKTTALWKVPGLRPFVRLVRATCRRRGVCSIGGPSLARDTVLPGAKPVPTPLIHRKSHIKWLSIEPRPL
jgi:hypothetical protein